MKDFEKIISFTDGGCKPNPGDGYIGIVICSFPYDKIIHEYSQGIGGNCTNNIAEYIAMGKGLELCKRYTKGELICFSDSLLVVNQLNGIYKVKDPALRKFWCEVKTLASYFFKVTFNHVNRSNERIQRADQILNDASYGYEINKSYI